MSMSQGKLEIIKKETEHLMSQILGLKWTGEEQAQSENYKVFYSGNYKHGTNGIALIVR